MKKLKLAPRERRMVLGGGISAVLIVLVYFVILPFLDRRQALKQDIEKNTATLKLYAQTIQDKDSLQGRKNELNRRMEKAGAKLLGESVAAAATAKLSEIADGILLKTVEVQNRTQVKEERIKEDYQKVSTQITFQCQIDQLVPALYEIRNYDKNLLNIDDLNITYQQFYETSKDPKMKPIRVDLRLSTIIRYMAPEKKEDKDIGRPKPAAGAAKA